MSNADRARDFAESKFKKREGQLLDGQKVVSEHEESRSAVSMNTDRLRALRLARDAAGAVAAASESKVSPVSPRGKVR